eukprot:1151247-Pelagomonas_calceolata.AAC.2
MLLGARIRPRLELWALLGDLRTGELSGVLPFSSILVNMMFYGTMMVGMIWESSTSGPTCAYDTHLIPTRPLHSPPVHMRLPTSGPTCANDTHLLPTRPTHSPPVHVRLPLTQLLPPLLVQLILLTPGLRDLVLLTFGHTAVPLEAHACFQFCSVSMCVHVRVHALVHACVYA